DSTRRDRSRHSCDPSLVLFPATANANRPRLSAKAGRVMRAMLSTKEFIGAKAVCLSCAEVSKPHRGMKPLAGSLFWSLVVLASSAGRAAAEGISHTEPR